MVRVNIIKGTNQIGGTITEVYTDNTRILIDYGLDLEEDAIPLEVDGLTINDVKYDALFITHNHADHIGLINKVMSDVPIYVEKTARKVYDILADFSHNEKLNKTIDFSFGKSIDVGDIKVTPYLIDHSAFNSAMFLIEAEGKKILHTGDYRRNGYKGEKFESTLKKIGKVDLLITEGTTLERSESVNKKESELVEEFKKVFKKYDQVFVMQATTNIDRITTVEKACLSARKMFVQDLYMASVVSVLPKSIPNPRFQNIYMYTSISLEKRKDEIIDKYLLEYNYERINFKRPFVMNIRDSMKVDLSRRFQKYLTNACLVYSMWDGYKEKDKMKAFLEYVESLGIDIVTIHTSGHADIDTIKLMNEIVCPDLVIPIHTTDKEKLKDIVKNVRIVEDGEEVIL